jgi:uncharacterized protein (DUF2225 family)
MGTMIQELTVNWMDIPNISNILVCQDCCYCTCATTRNLVIRLRTKQQQATARINLVSIVQFTKTRTISTRIVAATAQRYKIKLCIWVRVAKIGFLLFYT